MRIICQGWNIGSTSRPHWLGACIHAFISFAIISIAASLTMLNNLSNIV